MIALFIIAIIGLRSVFRGVSVTVGFVENVGSVADHGAIPLISMESNEINGTKGYPPLNDHEFNEFNGFNDTRKT